MRKSWGAAVVVGLAVAGAAVGHDAATLHASPAAAASAYASHEQGSAHELIHGTVGEVSPNPDGSAVVAIHWDRTGLGLRDLDSSVRVERTSRWGGLVSGWTVVTSGTAPG